MSTDWMFFKGMCLKYFTSELMKSNLTTIIEFVVKMISFSLSKSQWSMLENSHMIITILLKPAQYIEFIQYSGDTLINQTLTITLFSHCPMLAFGGFSK